MTDLIAAGLFGEVQSYAERHGLDPREALVYLIEAGLTAEASALVEHELCWSAAAAEAG